MRHDLAGTLLLFNDDGYLVVSFETWSDPDVPLNTGTFEISDAGGIYAGVTGHGSVRAEIFFGRSALSTRWYFFGDPCP